MTYSPFAMGTTIRELRDQLGLTQAELGARAGYGKGAEVSISRIERGITSPAERRLAGIATALKHTPAQLVDLAALRTVEDERSGRTDPNAKLKEQVHHWRSRHETVAEQVSERARITTELAVEFNHAHDVARDDFFLALMRAAETIGDLPKISEARTARPSADQEASDALVQIHQMTNGLASAAAAGAASAAAGAIGGGAAAYGAFTAVAMFGTAATGAPIASLSGVAATNATLAVLGGGSLAAGGAGMAGGTMLLTGMVAAPAAALAAAGFYFVKRRHTQLELLNLAKKVEEAENALRSSQDGFNLMVDVLERATVTVTYISIHGVHALQKWESALPPRGQLRAWSNLGTNNPSLQTQYSDFISVAAHLLAISRIDVSAFLTASARDLVAMGKAVDATLELADNTVRELI